MKYLKKILLSITVLALTYIIMAPNSTAMAAQNGSCGTSANWNLSDEGVLTISGSGEINGDAWKDYKSQIKQVIMSNDITKISSTYAFSECRSLSSVTLSTKLVELGSYAFENCTSLTSITIPASLKEAHTAPFKGSGLTNISFATDTITVPGWLFYGCKYLTTITLPDSISSIGNYAFAECSSLTNVTLSTKLVELGNYTFENCTSLNAITIPKTLKNVETAPFKGSGLTNIRFATNTTTVPGWLFYGCKYLTTIALPDSISSIGNYAFADCASLSSVMLPKKLKSIGSYTFENCKNLTSIIVPYTCNSIDAGAFNNTGLKRIYSTKSSSAYKYAKEKKIPFSVYHFQGATYTVGTGKYLITKDTATTKTVTFVKPTKTSYTKFTVLSTVKIGGVSYKVTAIGKNAFKNNKKLKSITIKTSNLTSIGKGAFTGIVKNAKITVPKKKYAAYKKLFKSSTGFKKPMALKK